MLEVGIIKNEGRSPPEMGTWNKEKQKENTLK